MTTKQTPSRFAKFLGALACAAALAPGLAGAQDVRHANRGDNDRFDNDRFNDESGGEQDFRFRGPRFEDPEIAALQAQLEQIEFRIARREALNEQLSDTLGDANRELRIATAQHRAARARFINSLGSRRQASAFQNYLLSSQRLMAASSTRARAVSQYNASMDELAQMEANRDRVQAALDAKIEARRIAVWGRRGHGRFPVVVTPPTPPVVVTPAAPPVVVVRPRHGGPAIVVTPVGRGDGMRHGGGYYASN